MKRIIAFLVALLLLAASLTILAEATGPSVDNVKAVAWSATQIKVSWIGSSSVYNVNYGVVDGSFHYYDTVYTDSAVISVAPETRYYITVQPEGGVESDPVYVVTSAADTTREFNYKYKNCALYFVNHGNPVDFWKDSSKTKVGTVQKSVFMGAGELRDYNLTIEFTLASSNLDRDFAFIVVMTPPDASDRYTTSGTITIPGSWRSAKWYFNIDDILQTYAQFNDEFAPGRYDLSLYFNGWFAGNTAVYVK